MNLIKREMKEIMYVTWTYFSIQTPHISHLCCLIETPYTFLLLDFLKGLHCPPHHKTPVTFKIPFLHSSCSFFWRLSALFLPHTLFAEVFPGPSAVWAPAFHLSSQGAMELSISFFICIPTHHLLLAERQSWGGVIVKVSVFLLHICKALTLVLATK